MPLTNYTDLQSETANWLNRTDLTSQIPSFVKAAEVGINRLVRTASMEVEVTVVTAGTRFIAFPTRMIEIKQLAIINANNSRNLLTPVAPRHLDSVVSTVASRPQYYTLRDQIEIDCTPDQNYNLACRYVKGWDLITDGTNSLMTNHPDVYLYSTLAQAAVYLRDADGISIYSQQAMTAIQQANVSEGRNKRYFALTELASGGAFDVVRGQ
jgi:hypothetical protein